MSNMAYCRYENTVHDLQDCYDHIHDDDLSPDEQLARKRLAAICADIANEYSEERGE